MKKQTLPLLFTLLLSLLFLSACVPDLKINFKKVPTATSSKRKPLKKVARVVLASRVAQPVQIAQATPLALPQLLRKPLLTSSRPKDSLKNAQEAPKDKIYATGNLKVAYSRNDDKIFAQTPDYEGYTTALVQTILGNPEKQITDPAYIAESFENTELENIKGLYHEGKITGEQAHAFLMGAVDLKQASKFGVNYTIYTYKNNTIQLVFENDQLLYITPNPDIVFFK